MIEIKLALCIEFPRKMGPGVFISCPDIMELFTIEQGDWTFERPGITAIAHPSPIEIGTTHGVFVLDEKPHVDCSKQSDLPLVRSLRIGAGACGRAAYRRWGLGESCVSTLGLGGGLRIGAGAWGRAAYRRWGLGEGCVSTLGLGGGLRIGAGAWGRAAYRRWSLGEGCVSALGLEGGLRIGAGAWGGLRIGAGGWGRAAYRRWGLGEGCVSALGLGGGLRIGAGACGKEAIGTKCTAQQIFPFIQLAYRFLLLSYFLFANLILKPFPSSSMQSTFSKHSSNSLFL